MPFLLPPSESDPILGDIIDKSDFGLQETARGGGPISADDATKIVSTGTLVFGIIFIVTTCLLYAYYYSTTVNTAVNNKIARSLARRAGLIGPDFAAISFVTIIENLDAAFVKWGLGEQDEGCKRKIVCEALLPKAKEKNQKVAGQIAELMSEALDASVTWNGEKSKEEERLKGFVDATRTGHKSSSCEEYKKHCPAISLESISEVDPK